MLGALQTQKKESFSASKSIQFKKKRWTWVGGQGRTEKQHEQYVTEGPDPQDIEQLLQVLRAINTHWASVRGEVTLHLQALLSIAGLSPYKLWLPLKSIMLIYLPTCICITNLGLALKVCITS